MFPDHYTVPEGLKIRLMGTVRWKLSPSGYHVLSLWREPEGHAYYHHEVWTPASLPFWMSTAMDDLVKCTVDEFSEHAVDLVESATANWEERRSLTHRFEELVLMWGVAEGIEAAFNAATRRNQ